MQILPATLLDLGSLRSIEQACFPNDIWPLLDLIGVLSFTKIVRFKAVADERMVGFVAGDPQDSQGFSWISTICVLPEYQGQGTGRALLRTCEAKLTTPRIRLCVRPENPNAIHLYESEGYQRVDMWHHYYKDGGAALVMEKPHNSDL